MFACLGQELVLRVQLLQPTLHCLAVAVTSGMPVSTAGHVCNSSSNQVAVPMRESETGWYWQRWGSAQGEAMSLRSGAGAQRCRFHKGWQQTVRDQTTSSCHCHKRLLYMASTDMLCLLADHGLNTKILPSATCTQEACFPQQLT